MYTVHLTLKSWAQWADHEEIVSLVAGNPLIEFIDVDISGEPPHGQRG